VTITVEGLNRMPATEAGERLRDCCGSSRWVELLVAERPFGGPDELYSAADRVWRGLALPDWEEAFAHHPRIGERAAARPLAEQATRWSLGEQRSAAANEAAGPALAAANVEYERRFGRIYIVCAAGRTADQLLDDLERRLDNDPARELAIAAEEQRKIIQLRLRKLLGDQ